MAPADGRERDFEDVWAGDRDRELEARIEAVQRLAEEQQRMVGDGQLDPETLAHTNDEIERLEGMQHHVETLERNEEDGLRNGRDLDFRDRDFAAAELLEEELHGPREERDLVRAYLDDGLDDREREAALSEIADRDPRLARELPYERAEALALRAQATQDPHDVQEAVRAYSALPWDQKLDMRERHDFGPEVERELEASDDRELARVAMREGPIRSQEARQGREMAREHPIERPARGDSEGEED